MRPRFTLSNMLLLMVIVGMAALMYRNHLRFQQLEAEIALFASVRTQILSVEQSELELRVASQEIQPQLASSTEHPMLGIDDWLLFVPSGVARNETWNAHHRARARIRNAVLGVKRARAVLRSLVNQWSHLQASM